jgi:hypothetical protein
VLQVPWTIPAEDALASEPSEPEEVAVDEPLPSHSRCASWFTEVDGLAVRATLVAPGIAELWVNETLEDRNAGDPTSFNQQLLFAAVAGDSGRVHRFRVALMRDTLRIFVDGQEPEAVAYVETNDADETKGDHRG